MQIIRLHAKAVSLQTAGPALADGDHTVDSTDVPDYLHMP